MNKGRRKRFLLNTVGIILCVIPVLTSIVFYFPIWAERGAPTLLSGFSLILILMATVPIIKLAKQALKSPAAYLMWLLAFVIFFMLSEIARDMTVICFVGFISNLCGAVFFKLAERYNGKRVDENEGEI